MTTTPKDRDALIELRAQATCCRTLNNPGCVLHGQPCNDGNYGIHDRCPWLADEYIRLEAQEAAGLAVVRGFDTSQPPHDAVKDAVPLVLYFALQADADEFVAIVQEAKPGMVAVPIDDKTVH